MSGSQVEIWKIKEKLGDIAREQESDKAKLSRLTGKLPANEKKS